MKKRMVVMLLFIIFQLIAGNAIAAEKEDTARLIGHKGIIANALREVVGVAGKSENKRIHIKFESFEDEKVD